MNGGSAEANAPGANMAAEAASSSGGLMSNTYSNAFVKGSPREGMQKIQNRLSKAKILTDELAEYFAARRDLESSYLKALSKIAKRSFLSDPSALGPNFLPVYERLVSEIGELASIHGELEKKLEVECEGPLRNVSNRGDWSRVKEHDDGLSSTLREINLLETQLAKDQKKVEGASSKKANQASQKVAETERSLRQTLELWETEAPFAFEAYQRIDAQRLETMKEVITKFETARSDAAQRLMASTEKSMQIVLNFEPQTDMQEFALKNATARGGTGGSSIGGASSSFSRPTTATPIRTGASASLTRRGSMGASTLLGRNSSHTSASPGQTNGVNEFGGRAQSSSASIHSNERGFGSSEQGTPSRSLGGSSLKSALTRFGRGRSNRNANDTQTVYGNLPEGPEEATMRPPPAQRGLSGTDYRRSFESRSNVTPGATTTSAAAAAAATSAGKSNLMTPLSPTRIGGASASTPVSSAAPTVDAEGYSIPPPDRKPWEIPEMANTSSLMGDDDDEERDTMSSVTPSKVTGMSIAQAPIAEDSDQDQVALERMKSTLLTSRSPSSAPQRRNTARRDRRDVRNTTYGSSMNLDDGSANRASTFGLSGMSTSPVGTPTSAFAGVPGVGSHRTQSIISSTSMSQLGGIAGLASDVATGLNAIITERVNVVFNGREISKMMVVGEIAVSAKDVASTNSSQLLRVESFEQLEKAAPNPTYLKASSIAGEYQMDLNAIMNQASSAANRVTVLKYQLHINPSRWKEYAPLLLSTQWRCEDHQTSILINYSINGESQLSQGTFTNAKIQDLSLSVDITSSNISNIMSKPTAIHSIEQKKLHWKVVEGLDLTSQTTNKALARFQVDEKSQATAVEARWRIVGANLSTLGLSIVDSNEGIKFGQVTRLLQSGKYIANP